ncbi:MAG: hypothetical protein ACREJ6_07690, partial [Candidatus Methylomirabilis sp.]
LAASWKRGEKLSMRDNLRTMIRMAVAVLLILPPASPVFALTDVGLPIHPKAIASTIVRQSGKGEGTQWAQVNFKANAPYEEVVRFYREKTGRNVNVSQLDSGKLLNTLILFATRPQDQMTINISSEPGKKVTEVEIIRNLVSP